MSSIFPALGNTINTLEGVVEWIQSIITRIQGIFSDVDFTILYNWLPSDISGVITAVIAVLLFLAIFGILKRVLFFLG